MQSPRQAFRVFTGVVVAAMSTLSPAQTPPRIGGDFIPIDAAGTIVWSVAKTMDSPAMEMFPVEVADAWCKQNIGFAASQVERIKVVIGAPGPGEPMAAIIVQLRADLDLGMLNPQTINVEQPIDVDGHRCFQIQGVANVAFHLRDPRTAILAAPAYLDAVLRAAEPSDSPGALGRLAAGVPHTGHLTALFAVEPVRPMVKGFLHMQADQIPPPLAEFTKVPDLLDAVLLRVNLDDQTSGLQMVMLARDEAAAGQLLGLIRRGLDMGRQIGLAQAISQIEGDDAVAQASRQYAQRMADYIVASATPTQDGRRLSISASASQGVASQGVLIALLLPAIQAAREAARRTASSNNLKMMGLAMHNHHAAHKQLPGNITSDDGQPLLSWRVAILPYLEQQALYDQFHLDEPWDSPHNLRLMDKMPDVYVHPARPTPPGWTVYQRPVGENYAMHATDPIRLRDITDGTSNTIMAVETTQEAAIEWTRPVDVNINPADPLAELAQGRGFHILMCDGAVHFLTNDVDPEMISAMLTRNGAEPISP